MPNAPKSSRGATDDALFAGFAATRRDLVQVASLGLVKAVDRFNYAPGKPFSAFAS